MQAGEESREVDPEQRDDDGGHPGDHPEAVHARVFLTEHVTEMEISDEDQPRGERPEFLRIPAPVIAPGELAPIAAEHQAERQQGEADTDDGIGRLLRRQEILAGLRAFTRQLADGLIGGLGHEDI